MKNNIDQYKGIYAGLKVISEASLSTRNLIKDINLDWLNEFNNVYKNIDTYNTINIASNVLTNITNSYKSSISDLSISSPSFNIDEYSKSFSKIMMNIQNICTPFTEALSNSIINSDYSSFIDTINNTLGKDYIDCSNIAFIKKSDIFSVNDKNIEIFEGLKSSIKDLNVYSANRLSNTNDISYKTSTNNFVVNSNKEITSNSKEINVVCSSMYLFEEYGDEIFTEKELMNFVDYLDNTSSFASENKTGKKIFNFIKHLDLLINFDKDVYYHARVRNKAECSYTRNQMLCAPTGINNPGRYNNPGRSYYYFSDTIDGCCKEIGKHSENELIQVAKLKPNKSISMIDLSGSIKHANTLLRYIRFPKGEEQVPKAYLLPCYISDCCRMLEIEGIKYRGSDDYSNYVTWNSGYFGFLDMFNKE